jgi:general secretion pathway protein J
MGQRGFTLLEVLMALTVFALIASLAYGTLDSAGVGFRILADVRDAQQKSGWVGRQLRTDMAYISTSAYVRRSPSSQRPGIQPLRIINDNRGDSEFDELWLLVREPGQAGVSEVHYYLDEDKGNLMRESSLLWARDTAEPLPWEMGKAASFAVEAMDKEGQWRQEWRMQPTPGQSAMLWPRALRIRMKNDMGEREWLLPISFGVEL